MVEMDAHCTNVRRRRVSRWLVVLGSLAVVLGLVGLTPLQGLALQAILLGPDSLVTPPSVHAGALVRDGHRLMVPVEPGLVRERLSFPSPALSGRPEQYDLYLPPGYDTPAGVVTGTATDPAGSAGVGAVICVSLLTVNEVAATDPNGEPVLDQRLASG